MTNFHYPSPFGTLVITIMNDQISSVVIGDNIMKDKRRAKPFDKLSVTRKTDLTNMVQKQLDGYFAGKLRAFDLPLLYQGTPFRMKVWKYLQTIPYGKTVSYLDVAKAIGHPKSARAVGSACKRNPIPIIIPCHRVIQSNGEMGEYSGGTQRKEQLLLLETNQFGRYND